MFGWFRSLFGSHNKKAMQRASVQAARHLVDTKGNPLSLTDPKAAVQAARTGTKARLMDAHDRARRGLGPQPDFSGSFSPRHYPEPSAAVRTNAYGEPDLLNSVVVPLLIMNALDAPAPAPVDPAALAAVLHDQAEREAVKDAFGPEIEQTTPAPHNVDSWTPASDPSPSYDSGPSYAPSSDSSSSYDSGSSFSSDSGSGW